MEIWRQELAEHLSAVSPGKRKGVISRYIETTGLSKPQLYRIAKDNGFETGRKRSDKGVLKSKLTDEQVEFVAALLYVTGRENKGPIMPVERALQIAVDNEIIDEGQIAPATMNRILRDRQLSKRHLKAPSSHTTLRSLHPNHTHVFDVSVCIQYYLKNGKLGIMDERDYYKNKPQNFAKIKTRLLRYVVVDHFSGATYFKYYDTTGETQDNLYDFLKEAWAPKDNDKLPFRGVPFHILMDRGSANTSKAVLAFLKRLDVNIPKGLPYNPRRQGACETSHRIIEEWFETGLRIQPATGSVEELNAWALDFLIWFQAKKKHSRHGMPRSQCWMQITPKQLREIPPDNMLRDLFANPQEERTVDGTYAISYRGNIYNLKHVEGLFRGAKVQAILKPWKWPHIDISWKGDTYEARPLEMLPAEHGRFRKDSAIIGESYHPLPETTTQVAKKRLENSAYGEERKKQSIPFEGLQVFGNHAEKVSALSFIGKRGTPIEVDRSIIETTISFVEFLKLLKAEIGPISGELNRELREKYGSSIKRSVAEKIVERLSAGDVPEMKAEAL